MSSTEGEPEITQSSRRATGRIATKVSSSSVARSVAQSRQSGGPTPVKCSAGLLTDTAPTPVAADAKQPPPAQHPAQQEQQQQEQQQQMREEDVVRV